MVSGWDPTDQTIAIDYARIYVASRPHSARTAARRESLLRNHLEGAPLGRRRLAAVRPSGAQARVAGRACSSRPRCGWSVSTHDLCHHCASVLLAAGESVVAVAERLGHENATLVLTTYGHVMPDSEDRTRKAVDTAWTMEPDPSGESATAQGRPRCSTPPLHSWSPGS